MDISDEEAKRLDLLKQECPEIAGQYGVHSGDLWKRFLDNCERHGVPGSVGRGRGTMKLLAREMQSS